MLKEHSGPLGAGEVRNLVKSPENTGRKQDGRFRESVTGNVLRGEIAPPQSEPGLT